MTAKSKVKRGEDDHELFNMWDHCQAARSIECAGERVSEHPGEEEVEKEVGDEVVGEDITPYGERCGEESMGSLLETGLP